MRARLLLFAAALAGCMPASPRCVPPSESLEGWRLVHTDEAKVTETAIWQCDAWTGSRIEIASEDSAATVTSSSATTPGDAWSLSADFRRLSGSGQLRLVLYDGTSIHPLAVLEAPQPVGTARVVARTPTASIVFAIVGSTGPGESLAYEVDNVHTAREP